MKTYSKEHIEQLLTRFMEGTSTLEEEDLLARYFKEEKHLPEAWKPYREMFAMFDAERDKENVSSMPKRKRLLPWYWTVAATITLLARFATNGGIQNAFQNEAEESGSNSKKAHDKRGSGRRNSDFGRGKCTT